MVTACTTEAAGSEEEHAMQSPKLASTSEGSDTTQDEIWDLLGGFVEDVGETDPIIIAASQPASQPCHPHKIVAHGQVMPLDESASTPKDSQCCMKAAKTEADATSNVAEAKREAMPALRRRPRGPRVPAEILEDAELADAIATSLPSNYEFEVPRTVWRLRRAAARHVGLQLPEGLTTFATALADILRDFVPTLETTTILGDVTFGACCIDDLAGEAVGVDFLVHYGHSCIVPTDQTTLTTLYVHVEVDINVPHLVESVRLNFDAEKKIHFMGSVQFTAGVSEAVAMLRKDFFEDGGAAKVPQVKPLGLGETLGCTSPHVEEDVDVVIFVCDGRFHLESAMIQNPHVKDGFFRYDPFALTLTRESYAHADMHSSRKAAIERAKGADFVGLILGTLGRQGSSGVLEEVERVLDRRGLPHMTLLLSEVSPERLALFRSIGAWVQVACPRLSLDWGDAFEAPLLTPYEAHVAYGEQDYQDVYPMDYYSNKGGPWSNYGAHNGHGGSVSEKFRHLRNNRRRVAVEYEDDCVV